MILSLLVKTILSGVRNFNVWSDLCAYVCVAISLSLGCTACSNSKSVDLVVATIFFWLMFISSFLMSDEPATYA
jgi:hypothetical protein